MYSNVQRGDLERLKRQERFTVGDPIASVGYLHEKNNLIDQVVVNIVATSLSRYVKQPLNNFYRHIKRLTSHFLAILWVLTIDDNRV